jgi:8-oxo-dGTP pyrophosphatase MutT (NUDIX family)
MKKTKSAGGVVVNKKTGKILVVNQRGRSWSLPKGHIDGGETSVETAKREISEESGISNLVLVKDFGSYERFKMAKDNSDDKSELEEIQMFLFETEEEFLKPTDKDNPEARWVEKEKVMDLLTHPKDKEFFKKVLIEIE